MSTSEVTDYPTFERRVDVKYDGESGPELSERGRSGRVVHVALRFYFRFATGNWSSREQVYWRWSLKSGALGEQVHEACWVDAEWLTELIAAHRPTSTIEIKESK